MYTKGKESDVQVMCRRAGRRAFRAEAGEAWGRTNWLAGWLCQERSSRCGCEPIRDLLLGCSDDGDRRKGLVCECGRGLGKGLKGVKARGSIFSSCSAPEG